MDVLEQLQNTLQARLNADPATSYVAQLYHKGMNTLLKKVGEECAETLIAAKDAENSGNHDDLVYEMADLWFHSMALLTYCRVDYKDVLQELARRFNMSGLEEKAQRTSSASQGDLDHTQS